MTALEKRQSHQPFTFGQVLFGHPRGVYLIAVVEIWERFSFYGMRGLLVLFLVVAPQQGGFGWSNGEALAFYGSYIGLAYVTPIIGGYVADNYIGPRHALVIGAVLMSIGHLSMLGIIAMPWIIGEITEAPIEDLLYQQDSLALGAIMLTADNQQLLAQIVDAFNVRHGSEISPLTAQLAYLSISYSFFAAVALIVIGTGFFKPNSYALLGKLYSDDDSRRENGVYLFQMAINLGAVFSGLVIGTVGEKFGWHLGFSIAGVGMVIGTIIYMLMQKRFLGHIDHTPPARVYKQRAVTKSLSEVEKHRLLAIVGMGLFSALYWMAAEQYGGLINLYTQQSTERIIAGFEIPATWFLSLNPFFIVVLTPVAMLIWAALGTRINPPQKFAVGFFMTAIGFVLMVLAFNEASAAVNQKSSMLWLIGAYFFVTVGELCILSIGGNVVNTYAPLRMIGSILAFWFLCIAAGNFISGQVGALTEHISNGVIFSGIAAVCFIAAMTLLLIAGWWDKLIHAGEVRTQ